MRQIFLWKNYWCQYSSCKLVRKQCNVSILLGLLHIQAEGSAFCFSHVSSLATCTLSYHVAIELQPTDFHSLFSKTYSMFKRLLEIDLNPKSSVAN